MSSVISLSRRDTGEGTVALNGYPNSLDLDLRLIFSIFAIY